jgi:hypothetical protein
MIDFSWFISISEKFPQMKEEVVVKEEVDTRIKLVGNEATHSIDPE